MDKTSWLRLFGEQSRMGWLHRPFLSSTFIYVVQGYLFHTSLLVFMPQKKQQLYDIQCLQNLNKMSIYSTRNIFSSSLLEPSMPPPPSGFPTIKQPIFEDASPSGVSVIHRIRTSDEVKRTSAPSFRWGLYVCFLFIYVLLAFIVWVHDLLKLHVYI